MSTNDELWKGIIEDLLEDFLAFFFPHVEFDLDKKPEFLDKELREIYPIQDEKHKSRRVDKLIKVWTITGTEKWILVHIEVQGYKDKNLPQRVYQYFYRIMDAYKTPVTSLVIFTDSNQNYMPSEFKYQLLGTEIYFSYPVYKVIHQDPKKLEQSDNPFAIVILTVLHAIKSKGLDSKTLGEIKITLVRKLLNRYSDKEKIRNVLTFIRFYIKIHNEKWNLEFEKRVGKITSKRNITMGIEEQVIEMLKREFREKAREEVKEEVLQKAREEVKEEVLQKAREEVKEESLQKIHEAKQNTFLNIVERLLKKGKTPFEISELLDEDIHLIEQIQKNVQQL